MGIAGQIAVGNWAAGASLAGAANAGRTAYAAARVYQAYALVGDAVGVYDSYQAISSGNWNALDVLGFAPSIGFAAQGYFGLRALGDVPWRQVAVETSLLARRGWGWARSFELNPHFASSTTMSTGVPNPFRRRILNVGDLHPQTGNRILAQVEIGDPIDVMVETAKPSSRGRLVDRHSYENPGHHDPVGGANPYNSNKSVLPANHVELFLSSTKIKGARYALDESGAIHQFQESVSGLYHWAGSENGRTLSGSHVPLSVSPDVRRHFRRV